MSNEKPKLYHERQKLQLCALHALNSLFQENIFSKKMLDDIVSEYDKSWCCNEYSTLFTGNYDLTILLQALERKNYKLRAIDVNEPIDKFDFKECFGLLLNIPLERPFFDRLPVIRKFTKPGRHWLTIKSLDQEKYYNFDSKLSHPELIGDQTKLINWLNELNRADTYMYIVVEEGKLAAFEQN
jgi:josephin